MLPGKQIHATIEVDVRKNTHEDQRGIQVFVVFLDKVTVILVGFAFELVVEVIAGAVGCSKDVWKERWQRFEHSILQTRKERRGYNMFGGDGRD